MGWSTESDFPFDRAAPVAQVQIGSWSIFFVPLLMLEDGMGYHEARVYDPVALDGTVGFRELKIIGPGVS